MVAKESTLMLKVTVQNEAACLSPCINGRHSGFGFRGFPGLAVKYPMKKPNEVSDGEW